MFVRLTRLVSIAAVAAAVAACGASSEPKVDGGGAEDAAADSGGATGFASSGIEETCGPADGYALRLHLYDEGSECSPDSAEPSLSFYLVDGVPPDAPATLTVASGFEGDATASWCPGGTAPCENASGGTITFDTFAEGEGATGSYDLDFASGRSESGTFDAVWCERDEPLMCG